MGEDNEKVLRENKQQFKHQEWWKKRGKLVEGKDGGEVLEGREKLDQEIDAACYSSLQ